MNSAKLDKELIKYALGLGEWNDQLQTKVYRAEECVRYALIQLSGTPDQHNIKNAISMMESALEILQLKT